MPPPPCFADRSEAGRRLASALAAYRDEDPLVLAIPRGGVVVAAEVACALEAPLDVIVVRKVGMPFEPEMAVGAVGPGGVLLLDESLHLEPKAIDRVVEKERQEMTRRIRRYRGQEGFPDVERRTVLIVDDGLATGWTARAAVQAVRDRHPRRIVVAVPVAPPDTLKELAASADDIVCLETPDPFLAVGYWYQRFDPVSDADVEKTLRTAPGSGPQSRAES